MSLDSDIIANRARAEAAADAAENSNASVEADKAIVLSAKTDAETAKDAAETARDTAVSAKDTAVSAKNDALNYKDQASVSASDASNSASSANTFKDDAEGFANNAEGYSNTALNAKNNAETALNSLLNSGLISADYISLTTSNPSSVGAVNGTKGMRQKANGDFELIEYNGTTWDSHGDYLAGVSRMDLLEAGQVRGFIGYATKALMDADLAHDAKTVAMVMNDATAANNGFYRKDGVSGAGSWIKRDDFYAKKLDPEDESEAVTGKAVGDYVDPVNESSAITELRMYDPQLIFSGFVNTDSPVPSHINKRAYKVIESGEIFGVTVDQGQFIVDDGVSFSAINVSNYPLRSVLALALMSDATGEVEVAPKTGYDRSPEIFNGEADLSLFDDFQIILPANNRINIVNDSIGVFYKTFEITGGEVDPHVLLFSHAFKGIEEYWSGTLTYYDADSINEVSAKIIVSSTDIVISAYLKVRTS